MGKPSTLKDLVIVNQASLIEARAFARTIFDGKTFTDEVKGYVITAPNFDDLPEHVRGFILKGILESKVENILDLNLSNEEPSVIIPFIHVDLGTADGTDE